MLCDFVLSIYTTIGNAFTTYVLNAFVVLKTIEITIETWKYFRDISRSCSAHFEVWDYNNGRHISHTPEIICANKILIPTIILFWYIVLIIYKNNKNSFKPYKNEDERIEKLFTIVFLGCLFSFSFLFIISTGMLCYLPLVLVTIIIVIPISLLLFFGLYFIFVTFPNWVDAHLLKNHLKQE